MGALIHWKRITPKNALAVFSQEIAPLVYLADRDEVFLCDGRKTYYGNRGGVAQRDDIEDIDFDYTEAYFANLDPIVPEG